MYEFPGPFNPKRQAQGTLDGGPSLVEQGTGGLGIVYPAQPLAGQLRLNEPAKAGWRPPKSMANRSLMKTHKSSSPLKLNCSFPWYVNLKLEENVKAKFLHVPPRLYWLPKPLPSTGKNWLLPAEVVSPETY